MSLTESLTVEITADSSQLESELERVGALVDGLSARLASVSQAAGSAVGSLSRVGAAAGAVNQLNAALDGVVSRLKAIRQTQVTIDVSAALAALARLSAEIARVAAQMAALRAGGARGPRGTGGVSPTGNTNGGPTPVRFASGGYVSGRNGTDRVAALVTAGEFVVRPEIVEKFGRPFFEQLNAGVAGVGDVNPRAVDEGGGFSSEVGRPLVSMTGGSRSSSRSTSDSSFHQDVTIQVQQLMELDDVLASLDAAELRQAERFG